MGSLGQRCLLFFIRTAAKGEAAVGTEWDEEMYDDGLTSWKRWDGGRVLCNGRHDGREKSRRSVIWDGVLGKGKGKGQLYHYACAVRIHSNVIFGLLSVLQLSSYYKVPFRPSLHLRLLTSAYGCPLLLYFLFPRYSFLFCFMGDEMRASGYL